MKSHMIFRAALSDVDCEKGVCRVIITVGDISVRSYPQNYLNTLGDLQLNRDFLEDQTLKTFFFGDEPLLNIKYSKDSVATVCLGKKKKRGSETLIGSFLINDGLAGFEKVIADLIEIFNISDDDIKMVAHQMEHDRDLGVYNIYMSC